MADITRVEVFLDGTVTVYDTEWPRGTTVPAAQVVHQTPPLGLVGQLTAWVKANPVKVTAFVTALASQLPVPLFNLIRTLI